MGNKSNKDVESKKDIKSNKYLNNNLNKTLNEKDFIIINPSNPSNPSNYNKTTLNYNDIETTLENNNNNNNVNVPTNEKLFNIIKKDLLPGFNFAYDINCTFITDKECCICFKEYHNGMIMHMLHCNHIFHLECLLDWYQKSNECPLCRAIS